MTDDDDRRQQQMTDACKQNNAGPLVGPVITRLKPEDYEFQHHGQAV